MDGTPYWGIDTFKEIRDIAQLTTKKLTIVKINDLLLSTGLKYEVKDIYSLFSALSDLKFLFIIEKEDIFLTWCKDIRFNYRDRFIYAPYYTYKNIEITPTKRDLENPYLDIIDDEHAKIRHDFELNQFIIDDRRTGYRIDKLFLYDKETKVKYLFNLSDLPYLKQENFSIKDLHKRYMNASLIISDNIGDDGWKDYLKVNDRRKRNREHTIRKNLGLRLYSPNFHNFTYTDVRQYELEVFDRGVEHVDQTKTFSKRVYEFEAYLYCIFAQKIKPSEEDYKLPFEELGVTLRHITISGDYPLVLKHYYKDGVVLRRKTYERFKEV